jgi:hypothetical protein
LGVTNINPNQLTYREQWQFLMENAVQANEDNLENIKKQDPALSGLFFMPSEAAELNREFKDSYPELINRTKNYYNNQTEILNRLNESNSIMVNVLIYDPLLDFGELSSMETGTVVQKLENAIAGITSTSDKVREFGFEDENTLEQFLESSDSIINELETMQLQARSAGLGQSDIENFSEKYLDFKALGLRLMLSVLKEKNSVLVINKADNLLNDYENWIERIDSVLQENQ